MLAEFCVKVDSLFMGINRINQSSIHSLAVLPHLKRTHPEAPRSTTNLSTWCSGYPLVMNTLQLNITILLESIIYKWAMASAMLNYPFRTCTYFKSVKKKFSNCLEVEKSHIFHRNSHGLMMFDVDCIPCHHPNVEALENHPNWSHWGWLTVTRAKHGL